MVISIITTTLNSEAYLRDTLESIKYQYDENIQYILVDGGSTDDTLNIAAQYDFVEIYEYLGSTMYEAIDFGFKKADGEILTWINSDDVYKDNSLKYVLKKFQNNNIDILTGNLEYIDRNGNKLYPYYFWVANKVFIDVFNDLIICQPATFFLKDLYEKVGGLNLEYEIVSDRDFFIRAFREAKVKSVNEVLVQFRIHGNNLSITRRKKALLENEKINARLKAGSNYSIRNKFLYFLGHFITKVFNPEMIWYKIRKGKWDIYFD